MGTTHPTSSQLFDVMSLTLTVPDSCHDMGTIDCGFVGVMTLLQDFLSLSVIVLEKNFAANECKLHLCVFVGWNTAAEPQGDTSLIYM